MLMNPSAWAAQKRSWQILKSLNPVAMDLDRIHFIRSRSPESLTRSEDLEALLLELGLNDEGLNEFPAHLHPFCGAGFRIWQYPTQFSKYLAQLTAINVQSYLELGVRHGGSFVATVEILERFHLLDFAIGVDVIPTPSMAHYTKMNPRSAFVCLNTQSNDFNTLIDRLGEIDLVFIDSHHEEAQCRAEFEVVRGSANIVAFHDICNLNCPGIAQVWSEVKATGEYICFEYAEQYSGLGPCMGIGLAVRTERMTS